MKRLKAKQFDRLLRATGLDPDGRTVAGVRLVMVKGERVTDAARIAQVSAGAISRALGKFPRRVCSRCGQAIRRGAS